MTSNKLPLQILHIEDSFLDAELIRECLIDFDTPIHIDWAQNEKEFLFFLKQNTYDIILADYYLPNFEAPSALLLAKKYSPDVPFICISGAIGEEKAVELLKQGATDYLRKDKLGKLPFVLRRALDEVTERNARKQIEELLLKKNDELQKAIEKAEENEKILNLIFQYSPILVCLKDENIRAIRLSTNFEQLLGLPLEQMLGKANDELWPLEIAKKMDNHDSTVLEKNRTIFVEEELNEKVFATYKFPIQMEGKPRYLVGFSIDVTERRQAEVKLQERTLQLNNTLDRIQQDLIIAKKIQNNILYIEPSILEDLNIVQKYIPIVEVGGDFYDISKINVYTYRVFLADATGHGVQAALITMAIKGIYDNIKHYEFGINAMMDILNNEYVERYTSLDSLITAIIVDIDIRNHKLKFVSAGHPAALLLQNSEICLLKSTGRMIGVMKDNVYKSVEMKFNLGDRLYIFTDGIFEQFNAKDEVFGEETLYSLLAKNKTLGMEASIQEVLEKLNQFLDGKEKQDDITILGIEHKNK